METTELQKTIDSVLSDMRGLVIDSQDNLTIANQFLVRCRMTSKTVEEAFAPELEAAQEKKRTAEGERKAVADKIKSMTDPLAKAEMTVKRMISEYVTTQERERLDREEENRRKESDRRLNTAINTGHEEILERPVAVLKEPEPELEKGTYTVDVWEYEIVDKGKINPAYLIPDEAAIRKTVQALKDRAREVVGEGVRVTCRKDVRVRT